MPGEIATRQADHQPSDVQPGEEFTIAARVAFFEAMGFLEEEGAIRFLLRSICQNVLTDSLSLRIESLEVSSQKVQAGLVDVVGEILAGWGQVHPGESKRIEGTGEVENGGGFTDD